MRVDGEDLVAAIAGRLSFRPVVGDIVQIERDGGGLRISAIVPRRSVLQRLQRLNHRAQPLVANAELLLVVASAADPPLRRGLVDRLLVAAWAGDLEAALCITKVDLAGQAPERPGRILADYVRLGYRGVAIDARTDEGIEAVRSLIGGRTAAVAGHSGVGKSTVVNALAGSDQAIGRINEAIGRGRHTTTSARLLTCDDGTVIIDTPGIRAFSLTDVEPDDLEDAFPEFRALAPCRYRGCRHTGDEGCSFPAAASPVRLESYRKLRLELETEGSGSRP